MKVPAHVVMVALLLVLSLAQVSLADDGPVGLPAPLSEKQLSTIREFNRVQKLHIPLKTKSLRITKRVFISTSLLTRATELNPQEWGDIHKEVLDALESKTKKIFEDRKTDLSDLLIRDVVFSVSVVDNAVGGKVSEVKDSSVYPFEDKKGIAKGWLHISATIIREGNGQYRTAYPDFDQFAKILENLAIDVRGGTYDKTTGEIPASFINADHKAALQNYHSQLAKTSPMTTAKIVWLGHTTWTKLVESEWGTVHKDVLAELDKRWKAIAEKRQKELQELLINRVALRCLEAVDPTEAIVKGSVAKVTISDKGLLEVSAAVIRKGQEFTYHYPSIDEHLDAYLLEQHMRLGTLPAGEKREESLTLPEDKQEEKKTTEDKNEETKAEEK